MIYPLCHPHAAKIVHPIIHPAYNYGNGNCPYLHLLGKAARVGLWHIMPSVSINYQRWDVIASRPTFCLQKDMQKLSNLASLFFESPPAGVWICHCRFGNCRDNFIISSRCHDSHFGYRRFVLSFKNGAFIFFLDFTKPEFTITGFSFS